MSLRTQIFPFVFCFVLAGALWGARAYQLWTNAEAFQFVSESYASSACDASGAPQSTCDLALERYHDACFDYSYFMKGYGRGGARPHFAADRYKDCIGTGIEVVR